MHRLTLIALSACLVTSGAFGLQLFGTPPTQPTTSTTSNASSVLSNEDFSKKVKSLNQQTQTNMTQQATDSLPKQPLYQTTTPPTPGMTAPPAQTGGNTTTTKTAPPLTPPGPSAPASPSPQAAPQAYTGFGTGTPNPSNTVSGPPTKSNSGTQPSGGWNIKY